MNHDSEAEAVRRAADELPEVVHDHPVDPVATTVAAGELLDDRPRSDSLAVLLGDLVDWISGYVSLPSTEAAWTLALWACHTWRWEECLCTPYLHLFSAEPGSGKTTCLDVLGAVVHEPKQFVHMSPATVFRVVEQYRPTLLIDEVDAAAKEVAEDLRGLLNSGYRYSGSVPRMVGKGSKIELVEFSTFCPKALAGLSELPATLRSRSIQIRLRRALPGERLRRFRTRRVEQEGIVFRERLEVWSESIQLTGIVDESTFPKQLDSRVCDSWEPLWEIADVAGGPWPARARQAAVVLSGAPLAEDATTGVRLLSDIREVWPVDEPNMFTRRLLDELYTLEESPWGEWYGKELSARGLAKLLRPYDVHSKKVRVGEKTLQGYRREDFVDLFVRYLPPGKRNTGTSPEDIGDSEETVPEHVPEPEPETPLPLTEGSGVPAKHGDYTRTEEDGAVTHWLDLTDDPSLPEWPPAAHTPVPST